MSERQMRAAMLTAGGFSELSAKARRALYSLKLAPSAFDRHSGERAVAAFVIVHSSLMAASTEVRKPGTHHRSNRPASRWPAVLALVALGGLFLALPSALTLGPRWLLPSVVAVLLIPVVITYQLGHRQLNRVLGLVLSAAVTLALTWSVGALIASLPSHRVPPLELLKSAAALWVSNILVFASWYWKLDAGGPTARDARGAHVCGAFLFPQMTMASPPGRDGRPWRPGFVDYLFLAFNTSTAFSPTDAPILSRWAKLLMMAQSLLSLGIIAILAARAVNIL
jgi:hypothetical protein